jgi:glycosyltransferase involved in cell wall biosynthesis
VAFNFHYPSLSAFPIAVLRLFGLYRGALILSFHGADVHEERGATGIERALWSFVLHRATAIVACSRALAVEVGKFAGAPPERVRAIHNGLDLPHFVSNVDRTAEPTAALRDREFIVSVATFEHKKGLDVLLRAFAELRSAHPRLALVLVGRTSPVEAELRMLARELHVAGDVFFYADVPHSQIGLFLERARVFCLASRSEPFGIALLEAAAYHLPVVASRVGGIPEVVIEGETGLLVEPGDAQALAAALDRVLRDGALARGLAERFHQRVAARFSWRRAYDDYRALVPRMEPSRT